MPPPERIDDPTIDDNEILWHRVPPNLIVRDKTTGLLRPSSGKFRPTYHPEISVDISSLTTIQDIIAVYPEHRVVEFEAGFARRQGCIIVRDPLPDNPAHALVCNRNPGGRLSMAQSREFAKHCRWVHPNHPN